MLRKKYYQIKYSNIFYLIVFFYYLYTYQVEYETYINKQSSKGDIPLIRVRKDGNENSKIFS